MLNITFPFSSFLTLKILHQHYITIITNKKSEKLSILDPKSLSVFVFLATIPSSISVIPQIVYINKNVISSGIKNSNEIARKILDMVIKLAKFEFEVILIVLKTNCNKKLKRKM